jgi:hypothetical protein
MPKNKTQPTSVNVALFLDGVQDDQKRKDSWELYNLMERIVGSPGQMWGTSIVGFGEFHYKYASGREGDWFLVGFSPRKNALTLYLMCDLSQLSFDGLGKYKKGKGCLYIKRLSEVNWNSLEKLIMQSISMTKNKNQ